MNDSGLAGRALVGRYLDGDPTRLVVIHDELDLPTGTVRVKIGGGTAGHNGLRSLDNHLKSLDFCRVRIGIGKPPGRVRWRRLRALETAPGRVENNSTSPSSLPQTPSS